MKNNNSLFCRKAINKKNITDIDLKGKKVLYKVDFNVVLTDGITVGEDTRIRQTLSTLKYLLKNKAKVIMVSHLGRPGGKRNPVFSIAPASQHLSELIKKDVLIIDDFLKKKDCEKIDKMKEGEIVFLENIRFYPEEEKNDSIFAKKLASLADIFVNDAFGVDHRIHASSVGVADYLPSVSGFLLQKEIEMIGNTLCKPKRPLIAIIGGAKAETKITLIDRLLETADTLLIGGGVANTFFKAWGLKTGKSQVDHEMVELARMLFWKASRAKTRMLLPTDVKLGILEKNEYSDTASINNIPKNLQALDIGPETEAEYSKEIMNAKTIIWNGPMGVYEKKKFSHGTDFIYHCLAQNDIATKIVGGGDTISCLKDKDTAGKINHISTGGGAMLEFIEKGTLPGIEALDDK